MMRDYEKISVYDFTTNPNTSYVELFNTQVLLTIVLHIIAYETAIAVGSLVLFAALPSFMLLLRVGVFLAVLMPLGYVGRLMRAKDLSLRHDITEVQHRMRTAYYCWYFIG